MKARLLVAAALLVAAPAVAAPAVAVPTAATPDEKVIAQQVIRAHYRAWLPLHPIQATELGLHDAGLDGKLPDLSVAGQKRIEAELAQAFAALEKLSHTEAAGCDAMCRADILTVEGHIKAEHSDPLAPWARDGGNAIDVTASALFPLIKRNFAPLARRAELALARLEAVPKLLDDALGALRAEQRVTKISISIALEGLSGTVDFIERDVPAAFVSLDAAQRARLGASAHRAADALRSYGKVLLRELLPTAKEAFAIGEDSFRMMFSVATMSDEPLPQLLARGEAELARLQVAFRKIAHEIDPLHEPRFVKDALGRDHASAGTLLADVRATLGALRKFVVDKQITTVTSEVLPIVEETPPFLRATTQASMDTPGPYEPHATEAYYHVTLPDPKWPAARIEDYLAGAFNRALVDVVSIHEAFPGHYVQLLASQQLESEARRMQHNSANVEGWAHYCEQMMLDEGWGKGAPKTRLAQLSDALLRAARFVVAIKMHTAGMTLEAAKRFFVEEGYQSNEVALLEAKRGTGDPMFLIYTWGKLEILKLREELKQKWGSAYTLRRFHDAFLAQGPIPLPLVRRALLAR